MPKVGDTIWKFDGNRRVYREKKPGEAYAHGGPIYREHWRPLVIVSETPRSWVTQYGAKCPKNGDHSGWRLTTKELDDDCFVHEHRRKISDAISALRDATILRSVAEYIGYKP